MKNYESLFAKIAESTEEFKQNLRYNEFEKFLTDLMPLCLIGSNCPNMRRMSKNPTVSSRHMPVLLSLRMNF